MNESLKTNYIQFLNWLEEADCVLIGAGSGLSTADGHTYSGERFTSFFSEYIERYGLRDMYSGGFYPFPSLEEKWGYWSKQIYLNRYRDGAGEVYRSLLKLIQDKDYFVLTTNVDHCFQRAGFNKERMFYTQGDYGLWQCSVPCHTKTYDNEEIVLQMVERQKDCRIPSDLTPYCPICGKPMDMNLRKDHTFVEDEGWYAANRRYTDFLRKHNSDEILFLELGVGYNTPGIIKYPFWQMTAANANAHLVTVDAGRAFVPDDLLEQSMVFQCDIKEFLSDVIELRKLNT